MGTRMRPSFDDEPVGIIVEPIPARNGKPVLDGVKKITDEAVILDITFHRPGIRRKGDLSKVETESDKEMLGLTKGIVTRKEYQAVVRVANDTRHWLDRRALPSPLRRGTYLVPLTLIGPVMEFLGEQDKRYDAAATEFLNVWPELVQQAQKQLKDQFDIQNYPSVEKLRAAFTIERRLLDFGVPGEQKLGMALWKEEKAKAEESWRLAINEIQDALRTAFRELVAGLAERLETKADGTRKTFRDSTINKLTEFIDLFQSRNLTGDVALNELVDRARETLRGRRKATTLRNNSIKAGEVAEGMGQVLKQLDRLLSDAPKRKISFEEDE